MEHSLSIQNLNSAWEQAAKRFQKERAEKNWTLYPCLILKNQSSNFFLIALCLSPYTYIANIESQIKHNVTIFFPYFLLFLTWFFLFLWQPLVSNNTFFYHNLVTWFLIGCLPKNKTKIISSDLNKCPWVFYQPIFMKNIMCLFKLNLPEFLLLL